MAKIEDLIDEVADPRLREDLAREIKDIKETKRFGLVFEEHIPETVSLFGLPIRPGLIVQDRTTPQNLTEYEVIGVEDGKATLVARGSVGPRTTVDTDELLVVKRFHEPIYPGLTRDSVALDIMETIRPEVDAYLIDLVESHRFRFTDFHETRKGDCRLLAPLTHVLANTTGQWRRLLAPIVEQIASDLLSAAKTTRRSKLPTPLTERRRSEGRRSTTRGSSPVSSAVRRQPETHACLDCGRQIPAKSKRCKPCDQRFQADRLRSMGNAELKAMRREGDDPNKTPTARKAVGDANREHWKARSEWDPDGQPTDPQYFRTQVFPRLAGIGTRDLSDATGLSVGYVRLVKKGQAVPHPRHWRSMASVRDQDREGH